jgi:hypothetical protein
MPSDALNSPVTFDGRALKNVSDKLADTLDALDYYGVAGVITLCLLPDGATYFRAGGVCVDLRGATAGLYATITALRDLAEAQGDTELARALTTTAVTLESQAMPSQVHNVH